jgi:hypothetical protein
MQLPGDTDCCLLDVVFLVVAVRWHGRHPIEQQQRDLRKTMKAAGQMTERQRQPFLFD